jgi:hypothetical protein
MDFSNIDMLRCDTGHLICLPTRFNANRQPGQGFTPGHIDRCEAAPTPRIQTGFLQNLFAFSSLATMIQELPSAFHSNPTRSGLATGPPIFEDQGNLHEKQVFAKRHVIQNTVGS